jgi:hypothetical protein
VSAAYKKLRLGKNPQQKFYLKQVVVDDALNVEPALAVETNLCRMKKNKIRFLKVIFNVGNRSYVVVLGFRIFSKIDLW